MNYKAEQIEAYFGDGSALGVEIRYLREHQRMGTAGALSLLPERPTAPIVVALNDKGSWAYVDAPLESASAGQKFLMRLGPQHETAAKAKLRDIRSALRT